MTDKCVVYGCGCNWLNHPFCEAHHTDFSKSPEYLKVVAGVGMVHSHIADYVRRIETLQLREKEKVQNERPS